MKCVIVAAGMSTRLRPLTAELPKCLLTIGGKTILERAVDSLLNADIMKIALVIGFQAEKIREFLKQRFPSTRFHFILNPNFATTNNAYSLLLAREFVLEPRARVKADDQLIVLDSDIVFHPKLLELVVGREEEGRIVVRVSGAHDDEEVRVSVDTSKNVLRIGKSVPLKSSFGESIGIEWFNHYATTRVFDILEQRVRHGNGRSEYYEDAFQEMIEKGVRFKAIDIGSIPVIEIDSPHDLERAERSIIPAIDSSINVRV